MPVQLSCGCVINEAAFPNLRKGDEIRCPNCEPDLMDADERSFKSWLDMEASPRGVMSTGGIDGAGIFSGPIEMGQEIGGSMRTAQILQAQAAMEHNRTMKQLVAPVAGMLQLMAPLVQAMQTPEGRTLMAAALKALPGKRAADDEDDDDEDEEEEERPRKRRRRR